MPGGSFKKWVKPVAEEGKSLMHNTYDLAKKKIVSHVLPRVHRHRYSSLCQEDGTATTSFVSESLQTVDPVKMTIEDEETFMGVAIQLYIGISSFLQTL
jgi:hypothetical protein